MYYSNKIVNYRAKEGFNMLYVLLAPIILFYMFFAVIQIRKNKINKLRRFLNCISYMDLKATLIHGIEKGR